MHLYIVILNVLQYTIFGLFFPIHFLTFHYSGKMLSQPKVFLLTKRINSNVSLIKSNRLNKFIYKKENLYVNRFTVSFTQKAIQRVFVKAA